MPRSNEDESPISLFSFQDIITSITGIMFLVVLLLVLVMLSSFEKNTSDPVAVETCRLTQELSELKKKLQSLQNNQTELAEQLAKLKKLTPAELAARKMELQQAIHSRTLELKNLIQQLKIQQDKLSLIQQTLENQQKQLTFQQEESIKFKARQVEIKREIAQLEKILRQQEKLMQFTIQSSSSKSPILLELSKSGIQLFYPDKNQLHDMRSSKGDFAESQSQFESFIAQIPPEQYYFCITVKPEAFRYAANVAALLQKNLFERGIELLPNDQISIMGGNTP